MTNRLFSILLLCVMAINLEAQIINPNYKQYTVRDGLAQMQAWKLMQDSRGYIWIGTKGGLSRFDGEKFTNYNENDGLINNFIDQVVEDFSGNIWVATQKGLSCFNGTKFESYPIQSITIPHIEPTPDGKIWFTSYCINKYVFGYFEKGQFVDMTNNYPEIYNLLSDIEYSPKNNALLLNGGSKLFELRNGKLELLKNFGSRIEMVKQDSSILIYHWDKLNNLRLFEYIEGKILQVAQISDGKLIGENHLSHEFIFYIPMAVNHQVYSVGPSKFEVIDFPQTSISACFLDRDQHLWLGTEEGLVQIYSGGFETYKRESLPMVWSMVEDLQHNIWFASYDFGLRKFDGKAIVNIPIIEHEKQEHLFYFQPQVDKRGVLYFPNNKGILYFDGKSFGNTANALCSATFYDSERDLLFGGYYRQIEAYNAEHQLVRKIGENDGVKISRYISSFDKDTAGNIWMGGTTGLLSYNWETNKILNYNKANGKLPSDGVFCIHTVKNGNTWFGGTQGLLWYDSKADSIRKIDSDVITESVNLVSSIDSSWLVFSQPTGIYLLDLKAFNKERKVELHLFNERNGFGGLEPGQNGAMKDSQGNIWMTSGTEVVKMDPKKLDFKKYKANVRISKFNGKFLSYSQKKLELPKNDRNAIVQLETVCFNRPKSPQYSWKIRGKEQNWSPWQTDDYIVLTDLTDDNSILDVKARIPGIPNSEVVVAMPLVVNLAIWKQFWFFPSLLGLVSLLVIAALILLYQTNAKMVMINRQAKTFQLQAILSQMNPHFIFNVLASLQSMILSANIEKANEYLVKMASLIRGFLDASESTSQSGLQKYNGSDVSLSNELEILKSYIDFQQLIYPEKFTVEIVVDPAIDVEKQTIPPMLIQPFVENSIRHGLLQKDKGGFLRLTITLPEKNELLIEIIDNGIGVHRAGELINKSRLTYKSRGRELTINRIKLLNELGYRIKLDTQSSEQGTTITIKIAINEF